MTLMRKVYEFRHLGGYLSVFSVMGANRGTYIGMSREPRMMTELAP